MIEEENNNSPNKAPNQIQGQERLDIRQYTPNRDQEKPVTITAPNIWSCFPFSERFWYSFCCKAKCCTDLKSNIYFSQQCLAQNCIRDPKLEITDKILQLSILKTGTLEIESIVVHPFVRIRFVNLKTGRYLQKVNFDSPVISRAERNFIIQHNKVQNRLDFQSSPLDIIPPVSTCPYNLREKGEPYAEWNEDFFFNEDAGSLLNTNVIIFFELLDFNLNYHLNTVDQCMYPMAWGYLKPVGFSQTYIGKHKIQLYKYKFKRGIEINDLKHKSFDYLRTPDVLYELDWIKKEKYQTFLQIKLGLTTRPTDSEMKKAYFYNKFIYSVFCFEGDDIDYELIDFKKKEIKADIEASVDQKKLLLAKWRRVEGEKCQIPNKLLYKFPTAKLGCLTQEFSHNGRYIAAACTEMNSKTTIKIFNVEEGALKYHFKGHHQLIHHFSWSFDDLLLISASADNQVSIWKVPKDESNDLSNLEYLDNESKFKLQSITHPAYVYSTDIYPGSSKSFMILATACFDGLVRFFSMNFNYDEHTSAYSLQHIICLEHLSIEVGQGMNDVIYFDQLTESNKQKIKASNKEALLSKTTLDHRHPNSIIFDSNQLFIGDSLGYIHIWELSLKESNVSVKKIKSLTHHLLEYDTINKLMLYPSKVFKGLIVHTRANSIRVVDLAKNEQSLSIVKNFFGVKCNRMNIKSAISPDGQYLLSGSETGYPFLWDYATSLSIESKKELQCGVIDSINDVSWNDCYNMTAVSAFGQEYPLLIHVYQKKKVVVGKKDLKMKTDHPQGTLHSNIPNALMKNKDTANDTLIDDEANIAEEDHQLNPIQNNMSQISMGYMSIVNQK